MEFWVKIAGLVRRRRVIVPALLVAVALGAAMYVATPVAYTSSTTMILTTTEYGGTQSQDPAMPPELVNPMLNFNDSLRTTSAILIEAMNTKDVATQLGARGRTTLYVDDGRTNPSLLGLTGPFLYIFGESTSPAEAKRVVQEAQSLIRDKLRDLQRALKAPEKTFVTLVDVVPPSTPAPNRARATKLGLLALIFGLGLSLGIAYCRQQTRDRRRARAVTQPSAAGPPPSGVRATRRLGWRPSPSPARAPAEGDAEPALVPLTQEATVPAPVPLTQNKTVPAPVPMAREKTELARVPMAQETTGPAPVAVTKQKNGTGRVPTSQQKNGTVPVATPTKKNGMVPVPTSQQKSESRPVPVSTSPTKNGTVPAPASRKKTDLALVRRSMKRKAELAVVPPMRPAMRPVRRPGSSPHNPEPSVVQSPEQTLVPGPVKRNGRSRNP